MISFFRTALLQLVLYGKQLIAVRPSLVGLRGISLRCRVDERAVMTIEVEDQGKGISDVNQAMEPFFTTRPEQERSGMGFAVMQTFMDDVQVTSAPGKGTLVRMKKRIRAGR